MGNNTKVTIATSIAPHKIEVQQKALSSWEKLGFSVISVNSGPEIAALGGFFPYVTFKEVNRNASALLGKPLIFFDDILKTLETSGTGICGIVNSDVHLIAGDDYPGFVAKEAQGGLVFGSRIDVDSLDRLEGKEYFLGFDFFFFSRDVIRTYVETKFCLGSPWWDYWAPIVPIIKGLPVKQLITAVAFHIQHPARWSERHYTRFAREFLESLDRAGLRRNPEDGLIGLVDSKDIRRSMMPLSAFALRYINEGSSKIIYGGRNTGPAGRAGQSMQDEGISEKLKFSLKRQEYLEDLYVKRIYDLQALHFRGGIGWKLTAPLRVISEEIKRIMKSV